MESFKLNTIEEAVADFAEGKFVIVVDDEDRENEDFVPPSPSNAARNSTCPIKCRITPRYWEPPSP